MGDEALVIEYLLKHYTQDQLGPILAHPITKELRIALSAVDIEFFGRYYFPHHFTMSLAPLHHTIFSDLGDLMNSKGRRYLIEVVFRGAGKSTIVSMVLPMWCIALELIPVIAMFSDSQDQAKEKLATLKMEMENNVDFINDFGALKGEKWAEEEVITKGRLRQGTKVSCFGGGMNPRGAKWGNNRPGLIILDDIEKRTDVASPTLRQKLREWLTRDVFPLGDYKCKVIAIGNMLHYDGIMNFLMKNPLFEGNLWHAIEKEKGQFQFASNRLLWDQWEKIILDQSNPQAKHQARQFYDDHETEMLEGTKVAWPEMFPYYELMLLRLAEGQAAFSAERLNEPVDPSQRFFKRYFTYRQIWDYERRDTMEKRQQGIWLVPWDDENDRALGWPAARLDECILFAATDPSMGQTATAHPSCITIIARSPMNQLFVLVSDKQVRTPDQTMMDQNEWWKKYPQIVRWAIEPNQFQAFFAFQLRFRIIGFSDPFVHRAKVVGRGYRDRIGLIL